MNLFAPIITDNFIGVGGYYMNFSQVSDEEVVQLMNKINSPENKTIKT